MASGLTQLGSVEEALACLQIFVLTEDSAMSGTVLVTRAVRPTEPPFEKLPGAVGRSALVFRWAINLLAGVFLGWEKLM